MKILCYMIWAAGPRCPTQCGLGISPSRQGLPMLLFLFAARAGRSRVHATPLSWVALLLTPFYAATVLPELGFFLGLEEGEHRNLSGGGIGGGHESPGLFEFIGPVWGRQMVQRIYLRGLAVERLEQGFTHDGFECHKPLKLWYQVPKLSILLTLDPAL